MTQEEEAAQAVANGIAWLEEHYGVPWDELRKRFDPPVNVKSQQDCVLAQLEGTTFSNAARRLGLANVRASELGFTVRYPRPWSEPAERMAFGKMWPVLQAEWEKRMRG